MNRFVALFLMLCSLFSTARAQVLAEVEDPLGTVPPLYSSIFLTGGITDLGRIEISYISVDRVKIRFNYGSYTGGFQLRRATDPTLPFGPMTTGQIAGTTFPSPGWIEWIINTSTLRFPAGRAVFLVYAP